MSARGRWFTDSLDEAQQRALAQSGRVLYLDIAVPEAGGCVFYDAEECGGAESSYVVSPVLRRGARVLTGRELPPRAGFLRLYRGTGPGEPVEG